MEKDLYQVLFKFSNKCNILNVGAFWRNVCLSEGRYGIPA